MVKKVSFIEAGYCKQFEKFVNPVSGKWRQIRFTSSVAIIEHAKEGVILFDTGYSPRFHEVTKYFPEKIYSYITPISIRPEETALEQLKVRGIQESDVRHVILSHFHADHVAGVSDFKTAKYVYSQQEYSYFQNLPRFTQVKHAFLKALLPQDFEERTKRMPEFTVAVPELGPPWRGADLFNDGSVILIPLQGHSIGHFGLFVRSENGECHFLLGDAAWLSTSFKENIMPSRLAQFIFYNRHDYQKTLESIHQVYLDQKENSKFKIIPCHCHQTLLENNVGVIK